MKYRRLVRYHEQLAGIAGTLITIHAADALIGGSRDLVLTRS